LFLEWALMRPWKKLLSMITHSEVAEVGFLGRKFIYVTIRGQCYDYYSRRCSTFSGDVRHFSAIFDIFRQKQRR
jgi:hypothetical protein